MQSSYAPAFHSHARSDKLIYGERFFDRWLPVETGIHTASSRRDHVEGSLQPDFTTFRHQLKCTLSKYSSAHLIFHYLYIILYIPYSDIVVDTWLSCQAEAKKHMVIVGSPASGFIVASGLPGEGVLSTLGKTRLWFGRQDPSKHCMSWASAIQQLRKPQGANRLRLSELLASAGYAQEEPSMRQSA